MCAKQSGPAPASPRGPEPVEGTAGIYCGPGLIPMPWPQVAGTPDPLRPAGAGAMPGAPGIGRSGST